MSEEEAATAPAAEEKEPSADNTEATEAAPELEQSATAEAEVPSQIAPGGDGGESGRATDLGAPGDDAAATASEHAEGAAEPESARLQADDTAEVIAEDAADDVNLGSLDNAAAAQEDNTEEAPADGEADSEPADADGELAESEGEQDGSKQGAKPKKNSSRQAVGKAATAKHIASPQAKITAQKEQDTSSPDFEVQLAQDSSAGDVVVVTAESKQAEKPEEAADAPAGVKKLATDKAEQHSHGHEDHHGHKSAREMRIESLPPAVHPPSPSKMATGPWLHGTFKTPKGRTITGEELCDSLERMTHAYTAKHPPTTTNYIATGTQAFKAKVVSPDELDSIITRLAQAKDRSELDEQAEIVHMNLKYDEQGKETWVPVKKADADEQKAYMCELYQRCLDSKKKAKEDLAAKYLQPLGKPRKV